ncbi:MAG TPA: GntR family transcriptional regulator [Chthoniobacteraceae bacterium]|nr:GntR family transcriptional regulator [Chthoniobacteraceae bacterium]
MKLPKKVSLAAQVSQIVAKEINAGTWQTHLPPERELASSLQVSRPTLRAALSHLEQQGIIRRGGRKGHEIALRVSSPEKRVKARTVGVLFRGQSASLNPSLTLILLKIQHWLHNRGYEMDLHFERPLPKSRTEAHLSEFIARNPAACWLLIGSNPYIQQWFSQKRIPAVVAGSSAPQLQLPCFDIDYTAACRHAAGHLWRKGHRTVAMLTPASEMPGDRMSEESFVAGLLSAGCPENQVSLVHHAPDGSDIPLLIGRLLAKRRRPTALLVNRPRAFLTVLSALQQERWHLPRDLSLICRDHEDFLEYLVPDVSRYIVNSGNYSQRILQCLLEMVETGGSTQRSILVIPEFHEGATVAEPSCS